MPWQDTSDVRVQVKADNVILISSERRRKDGAKYISMERRMGKFKRKFALPDNANTDQITTVSTVTVEKLPKAIEVKHEPLLSRGDQRKLRRGAVDWISLLPDELLLLVLSLLSFKEANETSLLSRRWRYLHAFRTKLDFDCSKVIRKLVWNWSSKIDEAKLKFLTWVDGVVRLNRSSRLEKFRVVLHLSESDTHRIDEWQHMPNGSRDNAAALNVPPILVLGTPQDLYSFNNVKTEFSDDKFLEIIRIHTRS